MNERNEIFRSLIHLVEGQCSCGFSKPSFNTCTIVFIHRQPFNSHFSHWFSVNVHFLLIFFSSIFLYVQFVCCVCFFPSVLFILKLRLQYIAMLFFFVQFLFVSFYAMSMEGKVVLCEDCFSIGTFKVIGE